MEIDKTIRQLYTDPSKPGYFSGISKAWVVIIKKKSSASSVSAFKTILKASKRKPLKIQADKGSEFFNEEFKKLCYDNKIHLYSTFSELKACIVERFNRTLREKMQRYFTFKD
jgi:hypothetical protein